MDVIDTRARRWPDVGRQIVARFNTAPPGAAIEALVGDYPADLREWFLEAGMRHRAAPLEDGGWRLQFTRGEAPAQGTMPGLHHVIAGEDGSVWACQRAPLVVRLDGDTGAIAAVAAVTKRGSHLARDAERGLIFVADPEADEILGLRQSDLAIVHCWSAPGGPQLPVVSPGGIVCVTGSRTGTFTIARPVGGSYVAETIAIGSCPHDPLVSRDGEHIFVPCAGSSDLAKVRLGDGRIIGRCRVGDGPGHLAALPDGSRFYVANSWDGTVTCLNDEGVALASAPSGGWAHAIEASPDGRTVWVANFLDDTVTVFGTDKLERLAVLETDAYPHGLNLSHDGKYAVVTGFASRHARVFDAASLQLLGRLEVGMGGSHTAFVGDTGYIACSIEDRLARVDLARMRAIKSVAIQ